MNTLIFATAIRLLTPVFLLFSVYILFRGHNHPGGGFIGGLIGSIAFVFHTLAHGPERTVLRFLGITFYVRSLQPGRSRSRHGLYLLHTNLFRRKMASERQDIWQRRHIIVYPIYLMAIGLFLSSTSGILSLLLGKPFLTAIWVDAKIPIIGSLGTPTLFDAGVYFLVLGMILRIIFSMSKE